MKPKKVEVEFASKNETAEMGCEGTCHIKALPYLSVVQSQMGSYEIAIGDEKSHQTGDGGFFVAPADVKQTIVHHVNPETGSMKNRWVFIRIRLDDVYRMEDVYSFPIILPDSAKKRMDDIFNRLFDAESVFLEYVCYYEIAEVLFSVATEKKQKKQPDIEKAISYIHQNYQKKLTVNMLSEVVNLSCSRFFCVFKKATGAAPIAYLNHYRLSVAAELLLTTDMRISEISDAVGIEDGIYFNKLFRKNYQMSPSRYRACYIR